MNVAALFFQIGGASGLSSFLFPLLLMFGIMYFMVIMPQQRQREKMQGMLGVLKNGEEVITNGRIYGTINGIDGDTIILKSAEQVKIRIARSTIVQVEAAQDAN